MLKIKDHYEQIVVGATCSGLGIALAQADQTLVIESGASVATAFVEAFRPGTNLTAKSEFHELTKGLQKELEQRGLLQGEGIHLPGLATVLFKRLHTSSAGYLFLTDILSIDAPKVPGRPYTLTLFNRSGRRRITADRIVDTTATFISDPQTLVSIKSTSIGGNLNLRNEESEIPASGLKGTSFEVTPGRFSREAYLQLSLKPGETWPVARKALHRFWQEKPVELKPWDLVSVAAQLSNIPEKSVSKNETWSHLPSALYDNPLAAFDAGVRSSAPQLATLGL